MTSYFLPILIFIYLIIIVGIAIIAFKRSKSLESFSVGNRNVNPVWIGIALAANMVSVATFVINPGLVYLYGWSGFLGYGISTLLGITLSLVTITKLFRKVGDKYSALTLPDWIGKRFDSVGLQIFYAVVSFLLITFIVMITVGVTKVVSSSLNIQAEWVMIFFMVFVFAYILAGGAVAHTMTNSFQGIIMIIATFIMLGTALVFILKSDSSILTQLHEIEPSLATAINPKSLLFRDYFEVFICNFIVGIAVVMQPHIMSKALFLRSEKDVNKYLTTAVIISTLFFMLIGMGLIARLQMSGMPLLKPDQAIASYLLTDAFNEYTRAIVVLGIICSSISTMEGLLLSISSISSNDLAMNWLKTKISDSDKLKSEALKWGRISLVITGIISFFLSLDQFYNPSLSVAIFAQNGVYAVFAVAFVPVMFGSFFNNVQQRTIWIAGISALIVHFGMYYGKITMYHNNPGVTVTFALVTSVLLSSIHHYWVNRG